MLNTPVLFLIFNRPSTTQLVFEQIKQVKPKKLFIAADGPRPNNPEDDKKVQEAKDQVLKAIDWECDVKTLFRTVNLGSGKAVSEAITWFFDNVDEGIILEDDCVPELSFFYFCSELLKKYRKNNSIMHITGTNFDDSIKFGNESYYFTKYPFIWGWATWKRAWKTYDFTLENSNYYSQLIKKQFHDPFERQFWRSRIHFVKDKVVDAWDYQWMFSIWAQNGISITPNINLVSNIGFGKDATHTVEDSPFSNLKRAPLLQLNHPSCICINEDAERLFAKTVLGVKKRGYLNFYIQRALNLYHKTQLLFKKFTSYD